MESGTRAPKPRHLGPDYGAQWQDARMARAYRHRPPYGDETFEVLKGLLAAGAEHTVLDVGCGTGDLARPFAARVTRIDAIDASAPMVAEGRARPGGRAANLAWLVAPMETAPLRGPYALAVAGESIHWMNWDIVFPRIASVLAPDAVLAIVERKETRQPWHDELRKLRTRYSTNQDYEKFDLIAGLAERGFFEIIGSHETRPVRFTQSREDHIECMHSRNGFSRERMGVRASVFDAAYRDLLMRHDAVEDLTFEVWSQISWGRPRSR